MLEFGDSNQECGVYAVLSLAFDVSYECIVLSLWIVQLRLVRLCKCCSCLFSSFVAVLVDRVLM